jgi:hypothetical protein
MTNRWVSGAVIMGVALMLSACNTTKATTDSTIKFFSSTTPDSILSVDGQVKQQHKINLFAGVNYDNLKQDVARGDGEYLTSLGTLMNVPPQSQRAFGTFLQGKYPILFTSELVDDHTAHQKMLTVLNREWQAEQNQRDKVQ